MEYTYILQVNSKVCNILLQLFRKNYYFWVFNGIWFIECKIVMKKKKAAKRRQRFLFYGASASTAKARMIINMKIHT